MYLSDKQVAGRYGVTREAVWKFARTVPGFPKPIKISGGTTRWILTEIEAFDATRAEARGRARHA